ncbi:hypothetical protein SEVIR_4G116266v4 [Setaria viridis]
MVLNTGNHMNSTVKVLQFFLKKIANAIRLKNQTARSHFRPNSWPAAPHGGAVRIENPIAAAPFRSHGEQSAAARHRRRCGGELVGPPPQPPWLGRPSAAASHWVQAGGRHRRPRH